MQRRKKYPRTPKIKKDVVIVEGMVQECLPGTMFKVLLDDEREILAMLSGKMRRFRIRILTGDRVKVEMSKYDDSRGRITYRIG